MSEQEKETSAETEPTFQNAHEEQNSFDKITSKGKPNGLFQQCMKAIRSAHFQSNRFRAALVVAGLFTDKYIYRDLISLFYVLTKEVEDKLQSVNDEICQIILKDLGYKFKQGYEQDLEFLYSPNDWKQGVDKVVQENPKTQDYLRRIQNMKTGSELAGAIFVLWGALIIGGGAAAKPKVQARFGKDAVNLFASVTGPGRDARKRQFIQVWDSLETDKNNTNEKTADVKGVAASAVIVESTTICMQGNNDILCSFARNPWWYKYLQTVVVIGLAILIYQFQQRYNH